MFAPNKYLYHYTKAETLLHFILPGGFRARAYRHMNDPREAKDWSFEIYLREVKTRAQLTRSLIKSLSDDITNRTLVAAFTIDRADRVSPEDHAGAGYGRPRMWEQYGDKHKGVCLVFDHVLLDTAISSAAGAKKLFSGRVDYFRDRPCNKDAALIYLEDILERGVASSTKGRLFLDDAAQLCTSCRVLSKQPRR